MSARKSVHPEFLRGAEMAASIAVEYRTNHEYRIDDCVLGKLNLLNRKNPRKNPSKLPSPDDAWMRGFVLALAEMHRLLPGGNASSGVCEVASNAGLTLDKAKKSGASRFDLCELRKAGVR